MLKYYLQSEQELKVLHSQLTRQGMKCSESFPWLGNEKRIFIRVWPINRSFQYGLETTSGLPFITCHSVTEVLKRTWNTWVEPKEGASWVYSCVVRNGGTKVYVNNIEVGYVV